jgi:pyrimidine deaminase RibD-like protein
LERAHNAIPDSPDTDAAFMAEALALAASTPVRPWPNPPVGALVVKNGRVVGRGVHHGPGSPHAETVALAEAGAQASGATLFVTLEPCNHTGRTPPCAPAVAASGVTRVVVAMRDPNPQVRGGGCRHLRERGLQVSIGVGAAEALELVWPFAVTNGFERPYVELKTAVSLDGRFAPPAARRQETAPVYLTMTDTRRLVHRRRRWSDAVIVGEGTARADRPRLDGRLADGQAGVPSNEPVAVCLDTDLSWGGGLGRIPFLVVAGEGAHRLRRRGHLLPRDRGTTGSRRGAGGPARARPGRAAVRGRARTVGGPAGAGPGRPLAPVRGAGGAGRRRHLAGEWASEWAIERARNWCG